VTAELLSNFGRSPKADQRRFVKAIELLDENDRHPSLRVHELRGERRGVWSASASDDLRIEFVRDDGLKILVRCQRHYA
jgi:mRNA-degrading endonuclease YafQ of YafQ-DinJ toxin-antitoxin module